MSVTITNLESALQTKINALTGSETPDQFVYLSKAIDQLGTITVSSFALLSNLPTAGNYKGRVAYVDETDRIYYSDGTQWVVLATSTNPNFIRGIVNSDTVTAVNYGLITDSVTTSVDYGSITSSVTASDDFGALSIIGAGIEDDVYIDPNDRTFTIYDGVTRGGVKHLRADGNNPNFETMNAHSQGIAHLYKNTSTLVELGTPTKIPFDGARVLDTRLGTLDANGFFAPNYAGWFQVQADGWISDSGWVGFGTYLDDAISGDTDLGETIDDYSLLYVQNEGPFSFTRVIYVPPNHSFTLVAIGKDALTNTYIYGESTQANLSPENSVFKNYTQMNIRYLGQNNGVTNYQV